MKEKINRYAAHIIVLSCILTIICFFVVSCQTPGSYQRMPSSLAMYKFSGFTIPETKPPVLVQFTVAVIQPALKDPIPPFYSRVVKSFSSSIGSGLDQIIVAKGMTTKGPYTSLDELPYPDKKNSNLTLTETVFIQTVEQNEKGIQDIYYTDNQGQKVLCAVKSGKLSVDVWLAFEMREPLSNEKMWIKRLDLGTLEKNYQVGVQKYWDQPQSSDPWAPNPGQWRYGDEMFNTKTDALAGVLNEVYPKIMNSAWIYLNTEELVKLGEKVKEIRDLKRY